MLNLKELPLNAGCGVCSQPESNSIAYIGLVITFFSVFFFNACVLEPAKIPYNTCTESVSYRILIEYLLCLFQFHLKCNNLNIFIAEIIKSLA